MINIIFPIRSFFRLDATMDGAGFGVSNGTLGLGYRYLNFTSNLLRYASEAAMEFYLMHMTFSVVTGCFVIQGNGAWV